MNNSSRFTVAVHILTLLALEERPLSSTHMAGSVNTNPVVIRRILGMLSKAGLVTTQLGTDGGSSLAVAAAKITLLDVYRVTERGDLFNLHHNQPNQMCPCGRNIQPILSQVFDHAQNAMETALAETTIAQVAQKIEAQL
ncbi:MAG: Rrf2 family transcriptional regulator [Anaerolineae bacterium]|nr:Rrf2 family transcriptional regulator [Anaerolineae bacterium]